MVSDYARKIAQRRWSFLGSGSEKKWYGTHVFKSNGEWDDVADIMMINFSERGHPVFRGSSAFERGDLKSKEKGKLSVRQSAQCLRSSSGLKIWPWNFQMFEGYGETRSA